MIYSIKLVHTIDLKKDDILLLTSFQCGRLPQVGEQVYIQINNEDWVVEVTQITTSVTQVGNSFMLNVVPSNKVGINGLKKMLESLKPKKKVKKDAKN